MKTKSRFPVFQMVETAGVEFAGGEQAFPAFGGPRPWI